ncbi:hypothetical protein pb186bvf_000523 [Paramecium bursaria]
MNIKMMNKILQDASSVQIIVQKNLVNQQELFQAQQLLEGDLEIIKSMEKQINHNCVTFYLYQQLLKIRDLNHAIQGAKIEQKNVTILKKTLIEREPVYEELIQQYKDSYHSILSLSKEISKIQDQNKISEIQQLNLQEPQKKFTLKHIVQMYTFELSCLKSYHLGGNLLIKLKQIEEDQFSIWIVQVMKIFLDLEKNMRTLIKICYQLQFVEKHSNEQQEKSLQENSTIHSKSQIYDTTLKLNPEYNKKGSISIEQCPQPCQCVIF